jgi:Phage stabilisation protein
MAETQTLKFADQDFGSLAENVSRVKLSNMYVVENPLSVSGVSYIPRPTLNLFSTLTGAIRGIWYQSQQGTTVVYVVAGTTLYSLDPVSGVGTSIGTIPGTDYCTFSSSIYHVAITGNGSLFLYNGTVLTPVGIPDAHLVTNVVCLDNYFIVGAVNTSKFYFVRPGNTTIDPLDFISAERNPDDIVAVATVGDELWVLGQSTTEVFADTGDQTAPFIRISNRVYYSGCADKRTVIVGSSFAQSSIYGSGGVLPCLIWVSSSKEVILAQGRPIKISNESIEELLKASTIFRAWAFRTNKHDFYVLCTDVATMVYDLTAQKWYRWSSYAKDTWDAVYGIQVNDTVLCATDAGSQVYTLSSNQIDANQEYLVCEVTGFLPNPSVNGYQCNRITLLLNYGFASSYGTFPVVEMRFSDDGGHTWTNYFQGSVGSRGAFDQYVAFRSLGQVSLPGRMIEIRFSEVQTFRFDGGTLNDITSGGK